MSPLDNVVVDLGPRLTKKLLFDNKTRLLPLVEATIVLVGC